MAQIISASIDVTKIDKNRLKEVTKKDGTKVKYLDISIVVNDEQDKFGNICSISEGQTKEERESKAPKNYLGNGKRVWADNSSVVQNRAEPSIQKPVSQVPSFLESNSSNDDIAF
jgi:hypothetical protein